MFAWVGGRRQASWHAEACAGCVVAGSLRLCAHTVLPIGPGGRTHPYRWPHWLDTQMQVRLAAALLASSAAAVYGTSFAMCCACAVGAMLGPWAGLVLVLPDIPGI
jgi:hypothetical protein